MFWLAGRLSASQEQLYCFKRNVELYWVKYTPTLERSIFQKHLKRCIFYGMHCPLLMNVIALHQRYVQLRSLSTGMNHNKISALSSFGDEICSVRMDIISKYDDLTKRAQNKTPASTCLKVVAEWLSSYRLRDVRNHNRRSVHTTYGPLAGYPNLGLS